MKKMFICILAVVVILSFSSVAFAGEKYEVPEVGITLDIPNGFVAIGRDTEITQQVADSIGTDTQSLKVVQSEFEYLDLYLDIFKEDLSCEILLFVTDVGDENMNLLNYSDSELDLFIEEYFSGTNEIVKSTEIKKTDSANWILADQAVSFGEDVSIDFFHTATVYNGKLYTLQLQDVYGRYTKADVDAVIGMLETAEFAFPPVDPEAAKQTEWVIVGCVIGGCVALIVIGIVVAKRRKKLKMSLDEGNVEDAVMHGVAAGMFGMLGVVILNAFKNKDKKNK